MRVESDVPGNYIEVIRDNAEGMVCIKAYNKSIHATTASSLTPEKAHHFAWEILHRAYLADSGEVEPMGSDW